MERTIIKYRFAFCVNLLLAVVLLDSCNTSPALFDRIASSHTNIHFSNDITENDSINPIDLEFLYNGGGVGAGDFNNDGLTDLYFTGNMVSNKLYLNKGRFVFTDVTATSNSGGMGKWCNAPSLVDINGDGRLDIYVCVTIHQNAEERKNMLYVNQGNDKNGIPIFREMAAAYGLADTSYSVHSAFFDYDNDGDLDMYLVTTRLAERSSFNFNSNKIENKDSDVDKLFRNDWNDSLKHPVFTDVSKEAGITAPGFGLGIAIADINKDGWKDIYVTNDFYGSDHLYINQQNGRFLEKARDYFKHTSQNAMGTAIADLNNDGLADVLTVDMNPEDNYRKKKNMSGGNYFIYQNMQFENIMLQYVRNTLQLNMGPGIGASDSLSNPVFGDIAFMAGVAETDWSWNAAIEDMDNDGHRDILITNGYPRDVTDHDFSAFRARSGKVASKEQLIEQIPIVKIPNYALRNKGNLEFNNSTVAWGMQEPSFSNGAVCVDLDNDGDLDYIVNNINAEAFVYRNNSREKNQSTANYLTIRFKGPAGNEKGIGAWATIYYGGGQQQVFENSPYRGYLSTTITNAFFGLGANELIDSVIICWSSDKKEKLEQVTANQVITADIRNARLPYSWTTDDQLKARLFSDYTSYSKIQYRHHEIDYIDFDKERLLPHKLSQYGPPLAAGDIDGNGLDDIIVGGNGESPGKIFLQQASGSFTTNDLPWATGKDARRPEQAGMLLFDADQDGDLDLYAGSGSNEFLSNTKNYQDQFFKNDSKGRFVLDSTCIIPINYTSKSCTKAADYDNDGDLDLFIGGKSLPGKYPTAVSSFIYRNDTKDGTIRFTDVTAQIAPDLVNIGMVCDGLWTDYDNDGFTDLILAGEWMPITFLKNLKGKFTNTSAQSGINVQRGWWNSITGGDFDNDGDIDYIAGNLGLNSFFRASADFPVKLYATDFDGNGSIDPILTTYLKDQHGEKQEYTALNRDDIMAQIPSLKKNFLTYKDFAGAGFKQLFSPLAIKKALQLSANNFTTVLLANQGKGKFTMKPLPALAQLTPIFGVVTEDFNQDGNLDLAMCGNDFGNEVSNGRYDAFNGLVLLGNGKGDFKPMAMMRSGFYLPGDSKSLLAIRGSNNKFILVASENKGPLKLFRCNQENSILLAVEKTDKVALLTLKTGAIRRVELVHGSSFLSQSSRFICYDSTIKKVEIINVKGAARVYSILN